MRVFAASVPKLIIPEAAVAFVALGPLLVLSACEMANIACCELPQTPLGWICFCLAVGGVLARLILLVMLFSSPADKRLFILKADSWTGLSNRIICYGCI